MTWHDIVAASIVIPVLSLAAVWTFRRLGRWLMNAIERSIGITIVHAMGPEMAHMSAQVTSSIDELRIRSTADHHLVEERLAEVEERLAEVESKLNIRPPDARTRRTD